MGRSRRGGVLTSNWHVMNTRYHIILLLALALTGNPYGYAKWFHGKSKKSAKQGAAAMVVVNSGLAGCKVDLDGVEAGMTNNQGTLTVEDVEPGAHYVHVQCAGQRDTSYFISPPAGKQVQVEAQAAAGSQAAASSLDSAVSEMQLRGIVSQAVQLRAGGKVKEAVELLRKATMLDPRNGDLHRELGITFLMFHDWESARIEMLEAVRREPDSVDAHSNLAYALEKLGDFDGALKQYRICTQMDPHDTSYRDHYIEVLGQAYAAKKHKKH